MKVFEHILYHYGPYVLTSVRNVCETNELYEECQNINNLLAKYEIDPQMTTDDWIAEFWKQGTSGQTALQNAPTYFLEAMQMCKDAGMFKNLKEEILP